MAAITQIKAFVADGKIGNVVVPHSQCKAEPVMNRRILYFVYNKITGSVCNCAMADLAPPSLDKRDDKRIRSRGSRRVVRFG
jgi:hypothetical protein